MKIYMALNEEGTEGEIGLHTRLAVLSAQRNVRHELVLLYTGERNHRTKWLENNGVRVVDSRVPYEHVIVELTREGRYWTKSLGHWLRTNLCLEEKDEEFVIYTDIDVVFMSDFDLSGLKPKTLCAAPEFQRNVWNYFNAGVMVANIPRLRADYNRFEEYLIKNIIEHTYNFHDQLAYNSFYREEWERLPVEFNWKPYWGLNENAKIVHFHGPKPGAMRAILDGSWPWQTNHQIQIGSLFAAFKDEYRHFLMRSVQAAPGLDQQDVDYIMQICERIPAYEPDRSRIDLALMNYRMFGDVPAITDNLAFEKSATQSSVCEWSRSQDPEKDAKGANNGIIDGDYGFHTAAEADPWWQVDLAGCYTIERVVIFNRRVEAARLKNFSISTSLDAENWKTIYQKTDDSVFGAPLLEPYEIRVEAPEPGRYLRVRLDGVDYLHFSEIQIYGPPHSQRPRSRLAQVATLYRRFASLRGR